MNQQVVGANVAVKVSNATHARTGQAGVTLQANGVLHQDPATAADSVLVRFDLAGPDGARDEAVKLADLDILKA